MRFARLIASLAAATALTAPLGSVWAQDPPPAPAPAAAPAPPTSKPLAGGVIHSDKTIADNVAGARDLADFTAAMRAADLTGTLSASGPFTVFAANRGGFDRLTNGTLAGWMRPDGKRKLTAIVTYQIVPELLTEDVLAARIKAGGGEAYLATVEGGNLTVKGSGRSFVVSDVNGVRARVLGGAPASNGMVYVVDAVLQP